MNVAKTFHLLSRTGLVTLASLMLLVPARAQDTAATLTGSITDAETGEPLAGANIYMASNGRGTTSASDGTYQFTGLSVGQYTVVYSFTGYGNVEISFPLVAGEERVEDISLTPGIELDPLQVTAGRQQAKALDAPASIDVITAREVEQETGLSPVKALRNVTGVDMAQTGVDRHEVVLRGFNNAFSGAVYLLTDYRQASVASLGVNMHSIIPSLGVDVERIEVVRGPGSALYGPGVTHGVVHYITKDPFTYPGATVSIRGGQRSIRDFQGRIAGVIGSRLGVKVTAAYGSATDFELENCDPALLMAQRFAECPDPHDAQQIAVDGVRDPAFKKLNINGNVEYRLGRNTSLILNGGRSSLTATSLSGIGTVQAIDFGYTYWQGRFQSGNFFAQAYINQNDAGDSYVYGGDSVVDRSKLINLQSQYNFSLFQGVEQIILGVDVELLRPNTKGTILGRNDDNDDIDEYGAYLQSTTALGDRLDLTLAARADYNNVVDKVQFSPRAALVFKPGATSSIRASYNRAFSSPGSSTNFLDILAGQLPGTSINIRARGLAHGYTWNRNPAFTAIGAPTDLVASSLIPGSEGQRVPVGLTTDAVYGLLYEGLAATPVDELVDRLASVGIPLSPATVTIFVQLLNPELTPVTGFSPGALGLLDLFTQSINILPTDLAPIAPLRQTTAQTFEVGYKGILGNQLLVAVDGYYTRTKDFIGPLRMATPFVLVPGLQEDLARDIATGIQENAVLANALGIFGLTPEAVANLLVQLGLQSGLPSATTPVAIVQPAENDPGASSTPELLLTYQNFGDVSYYGLDASVLYLASDDLSVFGNISLVNDDFFDNTELGEENEALSLALNASKMKLKLGGKYTHTSGVSVNASGRYTKGFPVRSGAYTGDIESYFVVDLGVGYAFRNALQGLSLDLGVSNLLDNSHREFIGAPKLGRVAIGRLTYSFDFAR